MFNIPIKYTSNIFSREKLYFEFIDNAGLGFYAKLHPPPMFIDIAKHLKTLNKLYMIYFV